MPDRPRTIAEMFDATVDRCGDQPALGAICNGELRWSTWAKFRETIRAVEEQLAVEGHESGDCSVNAHGCFMTDLAMHRRGIASLPITGEAPGRELLELMERAGVDYFELLSACSPSPRETKNLVDRPASLAAIQPTSGTSGDARYVMLSQENLVSNTISVAETIAASLDEDPCDEVRLSFLPFSHLYARVCDLYCWIYRGSKLVLAEGRDTIFRDCQIARPTSINGVPYFYQKAIDLADREKKSLREILGGEIRRCYSGGAALSPAIEQRFWDEGVPLLNGYGLSEASPVVTVSTIKDYKIGTVGKPLPGVEARISNDGEVLVRGPNVMLGYWGQEGIDEAATAEVIKEGWLHTGDLGSIDDKGFLTITGRKKETLVLATGKNVSPSKIEARLAASPWIEQVAVVGDGRNCLAAIIVPNPDRVRAEVRRRWLWVWSKQRALSHRVIRDIFEQEIAEQLADCPSHEQVRLFTLIGRAFNAERGEITAKLSLRREGIEQSFAEEIEALYG